MHPYVSSGLVYAPSSFISFILGMTMNNVERAASAGSPAHNFTVPHRHLSVSAGTVDILGGAHPRQVSGRARPVARNLRYGAACATPRTNHRGGEPPPARRGPFHTVYDRTRQESKHRAPVIVVIGDALFVYSDDASA